MEKKEPNITPRFKKGDAFVWLKRKHYFSAELNPHYFERTKLE